MIYRLSTIQGGAGFLPPTIVCSLLICVPFQLCIRTGTDGHSPPSCVVEIHKDAHMSQGSVPMWGWLRVYLRSILEFVKDLFRLVEGGLGLI